MNAERIFGDAEPRGETMELLLQSAPLIYEWSRSSCTKKASGGMEEWAKTERGNQGDAAIACDWYHSTWQLLRLLNMVAVPPWYEFYEDALSSVLRAKPTARVLVAACADYGMLATLHSAILASKTSPSIVVADICDTPLRACQWYAEKFGLKIECHRANLLMPSPFEGDGFDLIVTDEFLTVIKNDNKSLIAQRWRQLLRPDGQLVTTAMIGGPTTPELRERYAERARRGWRQNPSLAKKLGIEVAELNRSCNRFAELHNRYMISSEAEMESILRGLDYSLTRIVTPGECVNPTSSFQIVAKARTVD